MFFVSFVPKLNKTGDERAISVSFLSSVWLFLGSKERISLVTDPSRDVSIKQGHN